MDDLLDLNWTETKKPVIQKKKEEKPKDAFADLLPSSPRQQLDISKLSLSEQQQRMRNGNTSSSTQSSPWLTPLQASTPVQSSVSTPQQSSTPLRTLTPNNVQSSSNYSTPPLQQQQQKTQSSSSFGDLLDPFGSKKASQDKNTPLNQLRSQSNTSFSSTGNDGQWNFDLLDTAPVNKTSTPSSSVLDPFDMDSLKDTTGAKYTTTDEDNPLGILAGPAVSPKPELPVQHEEEVYIQKEPVQEEHVVNNNNRFIDEDEEDGMIAHLIDMGFSLQESRIALEATGNYDVQAAIDLLVQNSEAAQRSQPDRASTASAPPLTQNERARMALFDSNERPRSPASRRPQERQTPRQAPTQRQVEQQHQGQGEDPIQQQTEKIVAQAQEFGGFLYKNATSFLKTGREKVTKAVGDWQEQQRAHRLQQPGDSSRPKWMTDNVDLENDVQVVQRGFVDDADSDEEGGRDLELERRKIQEMRRVQEAKQREQAAVAHKMRIQQKAKQESLIGDDVYVSPSRRRGGNSGHSTPQSRSQTPVKNSPPPLPQQPKKVQRSRPIINAPADTMQKVNEARNEGNEKFKLGQFGDAEVAYTRALELLPEGHDHQVLLCNNRAVCCLKNGDYKKCIQDCDRALAMAQKSGEENIISEGVTIQWRDQIIKSLSRKGEAFENIEKYKEALETYNELVKYSGTPKVNQAMARCRQALNPKKKPLVTKKQESSSSPAPEKKGDLMSMFDPTMASTSSSVASSPQVSAEELNKSKAVAAMRAKAAQQEADDAEKLQKTDDVNARLVAWKTGKEQNLRALLATLDSLIWPGAQWKGAQMSELIHPKKCKIAYMKAIAKVHPDKLPADVTVEQKMIASGVFATLNQAWDAFKAQNPV
ncbi:hypothetical protein K501DRAFT_328607 [Backusella circina FSU 941]|nr:hypothetical protein K501DRAFT_328607 [Backusella circina FSU 941]